jgi:Xaa-Pro aminopeptidase
MPCPRSHSSVFVARRRALQSKLSTPALLAAGLPLARNYRANTYTYRAASHFLYLVGTPLPGAALLLTAERSLLFVEPEGEDDALWHGPKPSLEDLHKSLAVDEVRPLADLDASLENHSLQNVATLAPQDAWSAAWLSARLDRTVLPSSGDSLAAGSPDEALAEAMIALRLRHDVAAVAQMRAAADASVRAHLAGMRATRPGETEHTVCGAMIGSLRREGFDDAYPPIVTVEGEVLHHHGHENTMAAGDLLLADVGGESPEGWAADITRTWPVSGTFSPTQRAIYDVVLAAQRAAIDKVTGTCMKLPSARWSRDCEISGSFEVMWTGCSNEERTRSFFHTALGTWLVLTYTTWKTLVTELGMLRLVHVRNDLAIGICVWIGIWLRVWP